MVDTLNEESLTEYLNEMLDEIQRAVGSIREHLGTEDGDSAIYTLRDIVDDFHVEHDRLIELKERAE